MCLIKAKKTPIENGGRKAYKFLVRYPKDPVGVYHSPYYETRWVIGKTYTEGGSLENGTYSDIRRNLRIYPYQGIINGCAYHSYKELDYARYTGADFYVFSANKPSGKHKFAVVIAECTIPDDSEYMFEGFTQSGIPAYASEKLRVDKILETINALNIDEYVEKSFIWKHPQSLKQK